MQYADLNPLLLDLCKARADEVTISGLAHAMALGLPARCEPDHVVALCDIGERMLAAHNAKMQAWQLLVEFHFVQLAWPHAAPGEPGVRAAPH